MASSLPTAVARDIPLRDLSAQNHSLRRVEHLFVRHRRWGTAMQAAALLLFALLVGLPVFLPEPAELDGPLEHFTPLANYVLWGLWFPLVLLSVILTGRSWCGLLCPMGAASEWVNRFGLQRPVPRWLRWTGLSTASFILVTILGQTLGVRDHPEAMLEIFGATFVLALLVGWLYGRGKRVWCRQLCPIGLLLGVFSRLGAVSFQPRRPRGEREGYSERGVCPTLIDLARKRESRHCIECFRCVNPGARGGLKLTLRAPGRELAQIRRHNPNRAEVWFLFLGTGTALGGFLWLSLPLYQQLRQQLAIWVIERGWIWIGEPGPAWLMSVHPQRREVFTWLDFFTISGFMLACALAVSLVLGGSTALSAWCAGRWGADGDQRQRFTELAYQYAPVAMISLVLGLGAELFAPLAGLGFSPRAVGTVKAALFALALLWSLALGWQILRHQGLRPSRCLPAVLPGVAGSTAIAVAWWQALF